MIVGYQGDIGSNSEAAAKKFVRDFKLENAEL